MYTLQAPAYRLTLGGDSFLTYTTPTATRSLQGPVIEVDGEALLPRFSSVEPASVTPFPTEERASRSALRARAPA
jgi:hypothetical protein